MATIKMCDRCRTTAPNDGVRGFRWMGLMDKDHYKHDLLIKIDLCETCQGIILQEIKNLLNL